MSVTWSKGKNLSNCWSNNEKLIIFTTGNIKGSNHCFIGDLGKIPGWTNTHFTGCIGEIIGFHRILTDEETSYIHQYLMTNVRYQTRPSCLSINFFSSEVHNKGDPFQVRRHWATFGEFGQMTSRQCLYQKYTCF